MKFQSLQVLLLLQCKDLIAKKAKETAGEHYKENVKVIHFVCILILSIFSWFTERLYVALLM
jgi:hypothetical protein